MLITLIVDSFQLSRPDCLPTILGCLRIRLRTCYPTLFLYVSSKLKASIITDIFPSILLHKARNGSSGEWLFTPSVTAWHVEMSTRWPIGLDLQRSLEPLVVLLLSAFSISSPMSQTGESSSLLRYIALFWCYARTNTKYRAFLRSC